jgi:hypothetical protein
LQAVTALGPLSTAVAPALAEPVTNLVVVHGASADTVGWRPAYNILTDAYHMTPVQQPPTSFDDDVSTMKRVLNGVDGPYVPDGRSYAGAIKSESGNDYHVKSLAYITAHALDAGVTMADSGKKYLGAPVFIVCTPDNFAYLKSADHPSQLPPDLPLTQAEFEAHAQIPLAASEFSAQASDPAWKTKASWYMVAKAAGSSVQLLSACMERVPTQIRSISTVQVTRCLNLVRAKSPQ